MLFKKKQVGSHQRQVTFFLIMLEVLQHNKETNFLWALLFDKAARPLSVFPQKVIYLYLWRNYILNEEYSELNFCQWCKCPTNIGWQHWEIFCPMERHKKTWAMTAYIREQLYVQLLWSASYDALDLLEWLHQLHNAARCAPGRPRCFRVASSAAQ